MHSAETGRRAINPATDDGSSLIESTSVLRAATRPGVTFFLTVEELSQLTMTQWKVLGLLSTGKTPREVSEELWLGESTIATHRRAILKAFGVNSYKEAICAARRLGLVA